MTAAELREAVAAVEAATEGPWRWSENGNILGHMPDGYDDSREVCAVYTNDDATGAPNAPAIVTAVNFLRTHKDALLAMVADAERYRWLKMGASPCDAGFVYEQLHKTKAALEVLTTSWTKWDEAIDAARAHPQESE